MNNIKLSGTKLLELIGTNFTNEEDGHRMKAGGDMSGNESANAILMMNADIIYRCVVPAVRQLPAYRKDSPYSVLEAHHFSTGPAAQDELMSTRQTPTPSAIIPFQALQGYLSEIFPA